MERISHGRRAIPTKLRMPLRDRVTSDGNSTRGAPLPRFSFHLKWSSKRGMSILTGQMSQHAPHNVDANGNNAAAPPNRLGLTTEPIGPE